MRATKLKERPKHVHLTLRGDIVNSKVIGMLLGEENRCPLDATQFETQKKTWMLMDNGTVNFIPRFSSKHQPTASEWCTFIVDEAFAGVDMMRLETKDTAPTIFVVLDDDNEETWIHTALEKMLGEPSAKNIEIHGRTFHSYSIASSKLSKSQKKRFKEIEDNTLSYVQVHDDGPNRSKFVKVKNCEVLNKEYFMDYFGGEALESITCTKTKGKPKIQFHVAPLLEVEDHDDDAVTKGETKEATKRNKSPVLPLVHSSLIDDIPLGARNLLMLASYDNRRGCIKYPALSTKLVGDGNQNNLAKEFDQIRLNSNYRPTVQFLQLDDYDGSSDYDTDEESDEDVNQYRRIRQQQNSVKRTIMERCSLVSVAYHMTTKKYELETYGVASTVMAIGEDASTMVMQHCTLTTPGRAFIHRALACIGEGHRIQLIRQNSISKKMAAELPLMEKEEHWIAEIASELVGIDASNTGNAEHANLRTWHEYVQCDDDEILTESIDMNIDDIEEDDLYYFNVVTGQFIFGCLDIENEDEIEFMGKRSPNDSAYFRHIIQQSNQQLRKHEEEETHDNLITRIEKLFVLPRSIARPKKVEKSRTRSFKEHAVAEEKKAEAKANKANKTKKTNKTKKAKKSKKSKLLLQPTQLLMKKKKSTKVSTKVSKKVSTTVSTTVSKNQKREEIRLQILKYMDMKKMSHQSGTKEIDTDIVWYSSLIAHLKSFKIYDSQLLKRQNIERCGFVIRTHPLGHPSDLYCSLPKYDWTQLTLLDGATTMMNKSNQHESETKLQIQIKTQLKKISKAKNRSKNKSKSKANNKSTNEKKKTKSLSYAYRCLECNTRYADWIECKEHLQVENHMSLLSNHGDELKLYCVHPLLRGEH
jgi:hypothetical protein